MVNQLQRLGLPQTSSLEQKRLALDLAGLVIAWEKRRRSASGAKPAVRSNGSVTEEAQTFLLQLRARQHAAHRTDQRLRCCGRVNTYPESCWVLSAAQATAGDGGPAGASLKRGREDETPQETSAERATKQLKVSSSPFSVPPLPPLDPTAGAHTNPDCNLNPDSEPIRCTCCPRFSMQRPCSMLHGTLYNSTSSSLHCRARTAATTACRYFTQS